MRHVLVLGAVLAVVATACGDGGDEAAPGGAVTETVTPSPAPTPTAGKSPPSGGATATASPAATPTAPATTAGTTPTATTDPTGPDPTATTPGGTPGPGGAVVTDDIRITRSGSVMEPAGGFSQSHRTAECPIQPHGEQHIVDCAFAQGAGGQVLATIEEFGGDRNITVWERPGSGDWTPVHSVSYGEGYPDSPVRDAAVTSSGWVNLPDVVVVDIGTGGTGAFRSFEVYGWPSGAGGLTRLAVVSGRSRAVLESTAAGRLLVTATRLAPGDANCCPSRREVLVVDQPTTSPVPATRTRAPRAFRVPSEVALLVYDAWTDRDLGRVSDLVTAQGRQSLRSIGSPGEDVHELDGRRCAGTGASAVCTFDDAGGSGAALRFTLQDRQGDGSFRVVSATTR